MPPASSPMPPPPAPPYAPGACDVWEGRCIRAGAVLGTQFYAFFAIFILGAALLAANLRKTIHAARASDLSAESQALTPANPGSDKRFGALRASRGQIVPDDVDTTGGAGTPSAATHAKVKATGKTGSANRPQRTLKSGRGRRRDSGEKEMRVSSSTRATTV
jgi:hypothetical protein